MLVLVLDTETSGLPERRDASIYQTRLWPHVLQLSFIVYDTKASEILILFNNLIKIDESVVISPQSTEVHGITREACQASGMPITDALHLLNYWAAQADVVVAHNMSFDKRMLLVEYIRANMPGFGKEIRPKYCCTMKSGANLCKIETRGKDGDIYFKYPRLSELYRFLFGEEAFGLHDAAADVLICLRCFCRMNDIEDPAICCQAFQVQFSARCGKKMIL